MMLLYVEHSGGMVSTYIPSILKTVFLWHLTVSSKGLSVAMTAVVWLTIVHMADGFDDTHGRALQIVGRSLRLTAVQDKKSER